MQGTSAAPTTTEPMRYGRVHQQPEWESPATKMMIALQTIRRPGEIYFGTVPAATVQANRARNKRARQARAAHRRGQ